MYLEEELIAISNTGSFYRLLITPRRASIRAHLQAKAFLPISYYLFSDLGIYRRCASFLFMIDVIWGSL